MLSLVKMLLKGEVGDCAINSNGNYIVVHGKIMELCFLISVGTLGTAMIPRLNVCVLFIFSSPEPLLKVTPL